jgi:hypothetical protein
MNTSRLARRCGGIAAPAVLWLLLAGGCADEPRLEEAAIQDAALGEDVPCGGDPLPTPGDAGGRDPRLMAAAALEIGACGQPADAVSAPQRDGESP